MNAKKTSVTLMLVVAVVLWIVQAGIWAKTISHTHSETDKQNVEIQHQPNEIPGVAGFCLMILAAVIASIPQSGAQSKPHI
jgi:Na+(H+)/acetate symporter ActP